MEYRESYNEALGDLKSGKSKDAYKRLKAMSNYNHNSKILDIKKGPLLGKFAKNLEGKILTREEENCEEVKSYLHDHYNSSVKLEPMSGEMIQIK